MAALFQQSFPFQKSRMQELFPLNKDEVNLEKKQGLKYFYPSYLFQILLFSAQARN